MGSGHERMVMSREEWHATLAAGIRGDVEQRLARLEEVLNEEELHPGTRAYIEEEVAARRERLENRNLDDHWWRTQVGDLAIAHLWPDLNRLLTEGYSRDDAMEWLSHDGIDDPVTAALEWRGYTPSEYAEWRRAVVTRRDAERWLAKGWTAAQVRELADRIGRRVAGTTGTRDGDCDAQSDEMEAWAATGIPAHRVVLYNRLSIPLRRAEQHEEEARNTAEALDTRLATLAAIAGYSR